MRALPEPEPEKHLHITRLDVSRPAGGFCHLDGEFVVDLEKDDVFKIITDPDNRRVFKNIVGVASRTVVSDDGDVAVVDTVQTARWRFLIFSGTFEIATRVRQSRRAGTIAYELTKPGGFMRVFSGEWRIENAPTAPRPVGSPQIAGAGVMSQLAAQLRRWRAPGVSTPGSSLVHLTQDVCPTLLPPPPLDRYIRGITRAQMLRVIADLQAEAARRRAADGKRTCKAVA